MVIYKYLKICGLPKKNPWIIHLINIRQIQISFYPPHKYSFTRNPSPMRLITKSVYQVLIMSTQLNCVYSNNECGVGVLSWRW
jgi:hypothetical protein